MRWQGRIEAGSKDRQMATMMDLYPTFLDLAGKKLVGQQTIDGVFLKRRLLGEKRREKEARVLYYYHTTQLQAVRRGKWKLILPLEEKLRGWSKKEKDVKLALYDLIGDPGESKDVSAENREVVKMLLNLAEEGREKFGDGKKRGSRWRKAGWVKEAVGLRLEE